MVGTAAEAQRAIDGHFPYIGEGAFRKAYLNFERNVVYKVETFDGIRENTNASEWDTYCMLSGVALPKGWHIPAMTAHIVDEQIVIAVEFIDGTIMGECFCIDTLEPDHHEVCVPDDICRMIWDLGIDDLGYGNVIRNSRGYWIVDLGC